MRAGRLPVDSPTARVVRVVRRFADAGCSRFGQVGPGDADPHATRATTCHDALMHLRATTSTSRAVSTTSAKPDMIVP
jgi:hypothetical protein